jgi:hypothetical protein
MSRRHIFAIFKTGRTGSSRLAEMISDHPDCYCKKEVLNGLERGNANETSQAHIDDLIGGRAEPNVGFTLNPGKQLIAVDFFDYRKRFADRKLVVFTLMRKNLIHQALSVFVSRQAGAHAGSKIRKNASRVLRFVEDGVHMPRSEWEQLVKSTRRKSESCRAFARSFAAQFGVPVINLTYEGIYEGDHKDLKRTFKALGVTKGIPVPDQSEKLLPPPETFITNYAEIAALSERLLGPA